MFGQQFSFEFVMSSPIDTTLPVAFKLKPELISESEQDLKHEIKQEIKQEKQTQFKTWSTELQDAVNAQVTHANELTSAARVHISQVGKLVWNTVKAPMNEVFSVIKDANSNKGTPLRTFISDARVAANETLVSVEESSRATQQSIEQSLVPVREVLTVAQENAIKFNAFRKSYPAVVVGGAALVVGLPALALRGKLRGGFFALATAGVTAGAMFGVDQLEKYNASRR
ncbi:hypothetical protein THRCLA_03515 [Thraustotheca clavata]|uniref:Transmembrane protein n=1 Tax=Thraustotheca clavata TaxID=74557 RepID=A0A1W0A1V2_9STRA|nr:hypothetical protein THRCLA_03515 [Thraustotheca clavata]